MEMTYSIGDSPGRSAMRTLINMITEAIRQRRGGPRWLLLPMRQKALHYARLRHCHDRWRRRAVAVAA